MGISLTPSSSTYHISYVAYSEETWPLVINMQQEDKRFPSIIMDDKEYIHEMYWNDCWDFEDRESERWDQSARSDDPYFTPEQEIEMAIAEVESMNPHADWPIITWFADMYGVCCVEQIASLNRLDMMVEIDPDYIPF